ncbi:MAG: hypothetical protein M0C28_18025 [Candidatus Moduliflexus flocculans]|nr:hypothetical protein [Candidatus Moduliflexus flocculans]
MLQLKVGSSTGMTPAVVKDNVQFIDEEIVGADRRHRRDALGRGGRRRPAHPQRRGDPGLAGERRGVRAHPERRRHLLDDVLGDRGLRLGQLRRLVRRRAVRARRAACTPRPPKQLGVKKIVLGECGHAHKALSVVADRVLAGDLQHPARELR